MEFLQKLRESLCRVAEQPINIKGAIVIVISLAMVIAILLVLLKADWDD